MSTLAAAVLQCMCPCVCPTTTTTATTAFPIPSFDTSPPPKPPWYLRHDHYRSCKDVNAEFAFIPESEINARISFRAFAMFLVSPFVQKFMRDQLECVRPHVRASYRDYAGRNITQMYEHAWLFFNHYVHNIDTGYADTEYWYYWRVFEPALNSWCGRDRHVRFRTARDRFNRKWNTENRIRWYSRDARRVEAVCRNNDTLSVFVPAQWYFEWGEQYVYKHDV